MFPANQTICNYKHDFCLRRLDARDGKAIIREEKRSQKPNLSKSQMLSKRTMLAALKLTMLSLNHRK